MTFIWTQAGMTSLEELSHASLASEALANALAKINRYAGQSDRPWSLAAHLVLVSQLCPRPHDKAWALLAGAHHVYVGDLTQPGLHFCAARVNGFATSMVSEAFDDAVEEIDAQVAEAWSIVEADVDFEAIAHFRRVATDAEMYLFFSRPPGRDVGGEIENALGLLCDWPENGTWRDDAQRWIAEIDRLAAMGVLAPPPTIIPD